MHRRPESEGAAALASPAPFNALPNNVPTSKDISATAAPQRGGRRSRQKGDRLERQLVKILQAAGFGAERVPLSGSAGGSYLGDVTTPLLGRDLVIEAKARADGFRELYRWLDGRDVLALKADRAQVLVVLRLPLAIEIASAAEAGRAGR